MLDLNNISFQKNDQIKSNEIIENIDELNLNVVDVNKI
jgi:hypothetical protein